MYVDKIRLVGYYTSNTQNMRSEDIYIDEALKYAELMNYTFKSVKINNIVNGRLKKAITNNTVFIFEDQKNKLYAYYPKKNIFKISHVYFGKGGTRVSEKDKSWFVPGEELPIYYFTHPIYKYLFYIKTKIMNLSKLIFNE